MKSETNYLELTKSQLSLWTSQKLHHEVPLHNVAHTFEISGAIDHIVFERAFQELLNTTDVLRTVFTEKNGTPFQSFRKSWRFDLEFIDLSSNESATSIEEWVGERTQKVFDIEKDVFDSALIKINEKKFLWFLNLHHLITDGVTTAALFAKMSTNYSAILKNTPKFEEPSHDFEDYINFEKSSRDNPKNEVNRLFWQSKLNELVDPPKLYGSDNKTDNTTKAERFILPLGKDISEKLRIAAEHNDLKGWTKSSTIFNLLSTIFLVLLSRVSNQKKITIGTTVHNRANKNFQKTPGFFIEVYPLLNEVKDDDTFLTLYQGVKKELNAFLKNIKPGLFNPNMGRRYNVLLNFILTRFSDFNGFPTKSEWIFPGHISSSNLIEFHIVDFENSGEYELVFDINTAILNSEKRKNIPQQYERLLRAFLDDIHLEINAPSLVLNQVADSALSIGPKSVFHFRSVIEQFEHQATNHPDKDAICFGQECYSFESLNNQVNQLAHYLVRKNIGPNNRVGILLKRSPEYVISVMAILKTGATFIPIPANYPEERILYMLQDSGASLLVGNSETLAIVNTDIETISLDSVKEQVEKNSKSNLNCTIAKRSTAFIIYTSGSTGKPKGVVVSHESLAHYIDWTEKTYVKFDNLAMPLFTSVGFDITLNAVFLPLVCGGTIHIYQEQEGHTDLAILDVIKDNKINYLKLTPSHLNLLKDDNHQDSKIKVMAVIGEEFKADLALKIKEVFHNNLKLYNEYGPAEATIGCIYKEFTGKVDNFSAPIGVAIRNMEAYLLDEYKNAVPHGVVGELYLEGIGLADGYWGKPELTSQKFLPNPFKKDSKIYQTRDLARMDENGVLEYLGRTDFQVKIKGHRIELGEIESLISDFEPVKESVVIVSDKKESKVLTAFFTCKKEFELEDLQAQLAKKLPSYMVPTHYQYLDSFPLSPNGKIDRLALQKIETTAIEAQSNYEAPQTEIEELLTGIWKEVLKETKIGITDNFIAVGGHSLAAIRITSRINSEIELDFKLNKIFELPTIKEYAKHIEETIIEIMGE